MEHLKIYNTLDSTNLEAQRLLSSGAVTNGLTILALEQTNGRGQMGRTWIAQPGQHLAMTIIYRPENMPLTALPTLGMKISLGITEGIMAIDPDLQPMIKWPNDIYVHGKKLCGLLIENTLAGGKVQYSIIGIGMNVNEESFPGEIPNAISLHQLTGEQYSIIEIAEIIRLHVLNVLDIADVGWKSKYDTRVFGKEQFYSFQTGDNIFQARVSGVTDDGRLQLETEEGQKVVFGSHEVKWRVRE